MNSYIEERLQPYLKEKKQQIAHKRKVHKGLVLSSLIILVSALGIYLLGESISVLYVACFDITCICLASAGILFIFDFLFYANYKKNAEHLSLVEEQMNLCLYQEKDNVSTIETIEALIRKENARGY